MYLSVLYARVLFFGKVYSWYKSTHISENESVLAADFKKVFMYMNHIIWYTVN